MTMGLSFSPTLRKVKRQMDIQLVRSFSTTDSVLRAAGVDRQQLADGRSTRRSGKQRHGPHLLSISFGFLATYCSTRWLSRVFRMSVKYSSLPCRATVSSEATYARSLGEKVRWTSRVWMNCGGGETKFRRLPSPR